MINHSLVTFSETKKGDNKTIARNLKFNSMPHNSVVIYILNFYSGLHYMETKYLTVLGFVAYLS
jgi:hypothetical protein